MKVKEGYEALAEVLQLALEQSQAGKGKERHANNKPILQQPIMEIGRMVGPGYNIGQAMKKGQEAMRLPHHRAQAELLGAINYLAAAWLLIEETIPIEDRSRPEVYANAAAAPQATGGACTSCTHHTVSDNTCEIYGCTFDCYGCQEYMAAALAKELFAPTEKLFSPFTFPPALKFILQGYTGQNFVAKLREEVDEVERELGDNGGCAGVTPTALLVELWDVIHVCESHIRQVCEWHEVDPAESHAATIAKNAARNYYTAPEAP